MIDNMMKDNSRGGKPSTIADKMKTTQAKSSGIEGQEG